MAMDMFLKLDDIKGESVDKEFKGAIDILSWGWGATQSGSAQIGGGAGSGKVQVHDLSFTKYVDRASPVLFGLVCTGKPIKKAELTVRKAGGTPLKYLVITMEGCILSSVTHGGDGGADRHTETLSLNFGKVTYAYTPQKADGSADAVVTTVFDIAGNVTP